MGDNPLCEPPLDLKEGVIGGLARAPATRNSLFAFFANALEKAKKKACPRDY